MSHFDEVVKAPEGFQVIGKSTIDIAALADESRNVYAVQFHPEVTHTEFGSKILENFVFNICKAEKNWVLKDFIATEIERIRTVVGEDRKSTRLNSSHV